MAKNVLPSDAGLLSALLEGLQMSRVRLDAQIASVRAAIAGEPEVDAAEAPAVAAPAKRRGRKPGPKPAKSGRGPGRPRKVVVADAAAPAAAAPAATKPAKSGRRKLSPAARKAIAAAQKRRWEEFRKNNPK